MINPIETSNHGNNIVVFPSPALPVPLSFVHRRLHTPESRLGVPGESDVCPGCLIQRFQKYSVGEAATTQPPPPLATTAGCSSPATSFTQFPSSTPSPPSLVFHVASGSAHFCVQWALVPRNRHIPVRGIGGSTYIFISRRLFSKMDERGIDKLFPGNQFICCWFR